MADIPSNKLPPQSIDAEKSILGSIIIDREALNKVIDFLAVDDFYSRSHQMIYGSMLALFERTEPIDLLSLSNKLEEKGHLNDVGGSSYLTSLANSVPS